MLPPGPATNSANPEDLAMAASIDTMAAASMAATSDDSEPFLSVQFARTLFVDDITYEYEVRCAVQGIPSWTMRLTVEELSRVYSEALQRWKGCHDVAIPNQYGKVMRPETMTASLEKVLDVPALLRAEDSSLSQRVADLVSIPYGIRHIIQYDADQYDYVDGVGGHDDKIKYLGLRTMTFTPTEAVWSGLNGVCDAHCDFCDAASITSTSYWVRLLAQKVDLLLISSCNQSFYVMMSDFANTVAEALLGSVAEIDADCAWIIADYLPKQLLLDTKSQQCNAQIIYKYSNTDRHCAGGVGTFALRQNDGSPHPMMRRHDFDAAFLEHLQALCVRMQRSHRPGHCHRHRGAADSADTDTADVADTAVTVDTATAAAAATATAAPRVSRECC